MKRSTLLIGLILATSLVAAADQESNRLLLSDSVQMTEAQVRQFDTSLNTAAPGDSFALHLAFDQPLSLGELRQLIRQLAIPRVVAMVEFRSLPVSDQVVRMPFVLGLYYDTANAWNHQVCRATMYDGLAETSGAPLTEWPVREVHIIANTDAARALRSVATRYPATLIQANKQPRFNADAMRALAAQELAEVFTVRSGTSVDSICQPFVRVGTP